MLDNTKKFEYKAGMRVRDRYDRDYLGEVIEVVEEDEIHIRWDTEPDRIQRHAPCEIRPYDPGTDKVIAQQTQAKIDEAATLLEAAFKAWRNAQEIYTGSDVDEGTASEFLHDPSISVAKFEEVIENNGWSTSSLYC